jgi:hypothetical protein
VVPLRRRIQFIEDRHALFLGQDYYRLPHALQATLYLLFHAAGILLVASEPPRQRNIGVDLVKATGVFDGYHGEVNTLQRFYSR